MRIPPPSSTLLFASLLMVACSSSPSRESGGEGGDSGAPRADAAVPPGDATTGATDAGETGTGTDAAPDAVFVEGKHAAYPQVPDQGGPILTAPTIVTVTFPGDPLASEFQDFGKIAASSSWWNAVRAGYCAPHGGVCVGDGPAGVNAPLTTAPAVSYTDSTTGGPSTLQTWLATQLMTGALPAPDSAAVSNSIYLLYFPLSTSVVLDGSPSCSSYVGYHSAMTYGTQQVVYAVITECNPPPPPFPSVPSETLLQYTTATAGHEIAEASTDPANPTAFYLEFSDPVGWAWQDVEGGGEVADLCVDLFGMNQDWAAVGTFNAQRVWSNSQAAAGLDPCVPALPGAGPYFSATARQPYFVLDVGKSVTFPVDAFSTGPVADWTLQAQDWTTAQTSYLSFSIAGGASADAGGGVVVNNGATVMVTMTLTADPGATYNGEADGALVSVSGNPNEPTAAHFWPFVVLSTADAADGGVNPNPTPGP